MKTYFDKETDKRLLEAQTEEEVKAEIAANKPKGYTILIKGSNSTKLIQTVELL